MSVFTEPGRTLVQRAANAAALGVVMAVYMIVVPYFVTAYLPAGFGVAGAFGSLTICCAFFWPGRFDAGRVGAWPGAFGRRMLVVAGAAAVAGVVAFLIVAVMPGYITLMDQAHRASLVRRGMSEADIANALAGHRMVTSDFLPQGLIGTAIPGTLASLITATVGTVHRRRLRASNAEDVARV